VVAAQGQPLPPVPASVEVIHDWEPGRGPLAAVRDGLRYVLQGPGAAVRFALLVACDLPWLSPGVVATSNTAGRSSAWFSRI